MIIKQISKVHSCRISNGREAYFFLMENFSLQGYTTAGISYVGLIDDLIEESVDVRSNLGKFRSVEEFDVNSFFELS